MSGDLQLGGHYQLEGNAGGTVQTCEPPQGGIASYSATWEYGGGVTWITVRLEAVGADATRFELEHVAPVASIPDEMWDAYGPAGTGMGWDSGLLGLSLHLTDPDARPEDPMAWQVSDEGKRFMRGLGRRLGRRAPGGRSGSGCRGRRRDGHLPHVRGRGPRPDVDGWAVSMLDGPTSAPPAPP